MDMLSRPGAKDMIASARRSVPAVTLPPLAAPYAPPDEEIAARLLAQAGRGAAAEGRIDARATRQAMRLLGSHFVLGQTIEDALERASKGREFRYSYDMLGEGARSGADAARYFQSYARAIAAIGRTAGNARLPDRPGISVKL